MQEGGGFLCRKGVPWGIMGCFLCGKGGCSCAGRGFLGGTLGRTWKAVKSGLRCTRSPMTSERAQGSLSRRMDLVMRTRPMVVPVGQVTAELVGMVVSWNVCPSGREQPRVPVGPMTAAIQFQAKGQADVANTGLPLMGRKVHRKGSSWPGRGGFLPRKGSRKGLGRGVPTR